MSTGDRAMQPESEVDFAIQRALEAASLRTGDSLGTSATFVMENREPSGVETGDIAGAFDGE